MSFTGDRIVVRSGHTNERVGHEDRSKFTEKTSHARRHTTLASTFGIIEIDTSGLKRIA